MAIRIIDEGEEGGGTYFGASENSDHYVGKGSAESFRRDVKCFEENIIHRKLKSLSG